MISRKFYVFLAFLLAPALFFCGAGEADTNVLNARSAILVDLSGAVLFEQNADAPIPPASITKVLTLYLTFEAIQGGRASVRDIVTVSKNAANAPPSRMGLRTGERVSVGELIKGTGIVSGNDAAIALAEYVAGSERNFIALMNIKARQLGMLHSHFVNPNGLPDDAQLTTARDVARLSIAYLRRFPEALDIHSLKTYTYHNVTRRNANKLLSRCPGVDGLKTGFVNASRYNITATAARQGKRLIAVVLGAATPRIRTTETTRLLEYGFTGSFPPIPIMAGHLKAKRSAHFHTKAKTSKRGKTKKGSETAGKKLASSQNATGKKSTSKKPKQTTIAKKGDKLKDRNAKARNQTKGKHRTSVQSESEKVSNQEKRSASQPKS